MCGLIFWKLEHMLSRNAVPPHFRSDGGVGLHNVAGQGNATNHAADTSTLDVHVRGGSSEHALAVGDMRFHRCGASLRRQKLLSNCPCDHHSVACSVRLARATSHFTPQLYMQIPLGDLHASAISILAYINLLGISVPDVWKEGAEHSYVGARVWSRCFRARFYIGGR